jgi:hypothetical protein
VTSYPTPSASPPQPPYSPPPRLARPPRESAGYIPWWLLVVVGLVFFMAALFVLALVVATRPAGLAQPTATVVILTVPANATALLPTATLQSPPTTAPEAATGTAPPPPPGVVAVGAYVQVVGTGDAGFLNLRAEASIDAAVNYLAIENEVFQIQAGPTEADGFTWWYLVDPASNTRFGWGVQNYLQVVQP